MDGITLAQLAKIDLFDPVLTWGGAPLLLVKAAEDERAPVLISSSSSPEGFSSVETCRLLFGEKDADYVTPGATVVPLLKKGHRNPFVGMIYVGRADSNDVLLTEKSVSKCHCWFIPPSAEGGLWKLMDNGSTNGTFVNGDKLSHGTMRHIRPGDELRIGTTGALFIAADMLPLVLDYARAAWAREPETERRRADTESLSAYIRDRATSESSSGRHLSVSSSSDC